MPSEYNTIRQAAKRLGIAHTTAANHLRHKRFPLQREAPWSEDDMAEWQAWARETLQPNRADPTHAGRTTEPPADEQSKDFWLMRKYRAQALEQERKLLDTDLVLREIHAAASEARDLFQQIPHSAQGVLDLSDEQTKQLADLIDATLHTIADRFEQTAEEHGPETP